MDQDQQRDLAEEKYNREFCPACGTSPCGWDGQPDGFHTDDEPEIAVQAGDVTSNGIQTFRVSLADLRRAALSGAGTLRYTAPHGFHFGADRRLHAGNETGDSQ